MCIIKRRGWLVVKEFHSKNRGALTMFNQTHYDRLQLLANHLDKSKIRNFSMCAWNTCALHESPKVFGGFWRYLPNGEPNYIGVDTHNPHDSAQVFFGLDGGESVQLFSSILNGRKTQKQVAKNIRNFLSKKSVLLKTSGARLTNHEVKEEQCQEVELANAN